MEHKDFEKINGPGIARSLIHSCIKERLASKKKVNGQHSCDWGRLWCSPPEDLVSEDLSVSVFSKSHFRARSSWTVSDSIHVCKLSSLSKGLFSQIFVTLWSGITGKHWVHYTDSRVSLHILHHTDNIELISPIQRLSQAYSQQQYWEKAQHTTRLDGITLHQLVQLGTDLELANCAYGRSSENKPFAGALCPEDLFEQTEQYQWCLPLCTPDPSLLLVNIYSP